MLHRKSDFQFAALFLLLCILLGKPSVETTPFPPLVIVKLWIQYLSSFNHIYTIGIKTYHSLRMSNMASCSKNPFDKSPAKCTRDKCYRWDIWGSPNAFDSRSSLQIGHSHPFADSAIALFHTAPSFFLAFSTLCAEEEEEKPTEKYLGYFWPRTRNILCDIVSSCHLSSPAATIYFAILGPNSVPRSFPCHWSGPPVLPNGGNAPPPPPSERRNKEGGYPPTPHPKNKETKKAGMKLRDCKFGGG